MGRVLGLKDDVLKTSDFSLHLSRQSRSSCFSRMSRVNHDIVYMFGQRRLVLVLPEVCAGRYGFGGLEKEARAAKKGLWADPEPTSPWKGCKRK